MSNMNMKRGAILLVMFVSYLLIGGAIFMQFEGEEHQQDNPSYEALLEFKEILLSNESREVVGVDEFTWAAHINYVFRNLTSKDEYGLNKTQPKWSFYDATFFCLTVITTIGYGNKTPSNERSRGFCIFYALLGIPLTGIWMATVGDYFSKKLLKAHNKTKNMNTRSPRLALFINTFTYLIPGFVIFLILPASIFMALEEWTFLDSFYYSVITLTTIGFGDLVAGTGNGEYKWMYKVLLMIWIIFGLGYLSMILNFIAKAYKSKHMKKIERTLTKNLKQTQEAFAKEVDVLVKSLNVYISKIKDKEETIERTSSCSSLDSVGGVLQNSFVEEGRNHTETSANFIFDLAMAFACGELEREKSDVPTTQDEEGSQQRSTNVAQLLTMALLPQLRGGAASNGHTVPATPPSPTHNTEKRRSFFDIFKKKDDATQVENGRTAKSNSIAEGFLFPFGANVLVPQNNRSNGRRRQSEMVSNLERDLYRIGMRHQWDSLSKEIKALAKGEAGSKVMQEESEEHSAASNGEPTEVVVMAADENKKQHNRRRHSLPQQLDSISEKTSSNEETSEKSTKLDDGKN